MAKALIGHLNGDVRMPSRLAVENARLRTRVSDLEALVLRLSQDNDRLETAHSELLEASLAELRECSHMQPA